MPILGPQILDNRLIRYAIIRLFLHSINEDTRSLCAEIAIKYLRADDRIYAQGLAYVIFKECQKLHLDISVALEVADALNGGRYGDFGQLVSKELLK